MRLNQLLIINYSLFIEDAFFPPFIQAIAYAPVSGFRSYAAGALSNVGTSGHFWSSSPQSGSTDASHLDFRSTAFFAQVGNPRSYAFTVRCVQHLRLLFKRNLVYSLEGCCPAKYKFHLLLPSACTLLRRRFSLDREH